MEEKKESVRVDFAMAERTLSALNELMSEATGGLPVQHWDIVNEVCVFFEQAKRKLRGAVK